MDAIKLSPADLKVTDLKKELEKRGLSKSGNKAQLIDRLKKFLESNGETLESVFAAQVAAQRAHATVSGSDMARWSQVAKPSHTTTSTPVDEQATSPVIPKDIVNVQPQENCEQNVAQEQPVITNSILQEVDCSELCQTENIQPPVNEAAHVSNIPQNPVEVAQISEPAVQPVAEEVPCSVVETAAEPISSTEQTVEPLTEQEPVLENASVEQTEVLMKEPEPVLENAAVEQAAVPVVEPEPVGESTPVEQEAVQAVEPEPVKENAPVEQKSAESVKSATTDKESAQAVDSAPGAYSDHLLSGVESQESFNSPLSVHEDQGLLSPDETVPDVTVTPSKEKSVVDEEEEPPKFAIDPQMLVPRRQLKMTEQRLAKSGGQCPHGIRKRKWSDEISNQPPAKNLAISSDSLKAMDLPDVSDIEEETTEVGEHDGPRRRRILQAENSVLKTNVSENEEGGNMMDTLELTAEHDELGGGDDLASSRASKRTLAKKSSTTNIAPVSLDVDEPKRAKRQVSPPRSEPTNILHVENLVRPFSLGQLKELLNRVGTVDESMFWTDKIKSHCIVGYATKEDAEKTREALHGTQWPSTNPKILSVDFVTPEFLQKHKNLEEGSTKLTSATIAAVGISITSSGRRVVKGSVTSENGGDSSNDASARLFKGALNGNSETRRLVKTVENFKVSSDHNAPLRDKQVTDREKRDRRRVSDEPKEEETADEKRVSLDDLFKRTKTSPHLYWLPLTEEEAVKREESRRERELERKKEQEAREAREKEREKQREKEREQREKEREERQKEREREREKERERQRQREKEMEKERERQRERDREREKEREKERERERERERRNRERKDQEMRSKRRSPSDRGRRQSPQPFKDPVTPPPFKGRRSRSKSRSSSSRSSSSSSSVSSTSSSASSHSSRSKSSGRRRR